ncbi:glycosylase [Luminiphilus sp. nBUS_16]|uniref:glycosylase n=1 Tax=Luminiphilus sp. nBUS_16 TaxID=3395315 RepID=UPI003EB99B5E
MGRDEEYFKWIKCGKVFDPQDLKTASWMDKFAQSPSVLVKDNGVRIFFCSRPPLDVTGLYVSRLAYVDVSHDNLTEVIKVCEQPLLALGDYGCFDEFGTNPVSVIRNDQEIWAYYAGWTRCESVPFNAAIGLAISKNGGETFERLGAGPVLSFTPDEPFLLGSPRIKRFNGGWQLWYVAGKEWKVLDGTTEPIYKIRMAVSDDGIHWKKLGKDLIPDVIGEHECQACADVTFCNGIYHMFFSFRDIRDYKGPFGGYRMGYASSIDMETWIRDDGRSQLTLSASGWDSGMVSYPHVFAFKGKTYMLYQGNGMGLEGFGLAVLQDETVWAAK